MSRGFEHVAIAVLVPCYNEARTIRSVVSAFRDALPRAAIYVYDNNSSDGTATLAREAGAIVRFELLQGKGNVVRRMFADIEADIYVLVDGDDTYDAAQAPSLIEALLEGRLDYVNGRRVSTGSDAFRTGHRFGNWLLTSLVAAMFGNRLNDMLSGYKVLSRRFVKSFPALASGFETETELAVHALDLRMPMAEIETPYKERPPGSASKLSTFRDGYRILQTILLLVKEERPLQFFAGIFALLALTSIGLAWPIVLEFIRTGLVPRLPTAVLATSIMLLAFLSLTCGLILDTVTHGRREMKRLHYLATSLRRGGPICGTASLSPAELVEAEPRIRAPLADRVAAHVESEATPAESRSC
jgi:glycosyltransferase involved in cell wall biosynthesis